MPAVVPLLSGGGSAGLPTSWSSKTQVASGLAANAQHAYCTDGDKRVWAAYSDGTSVFVKRSDDEGNTWNAAVTVATSDTIPLDQPIFYDKTIGGNGRLHFFYALQTDNAGLPAILKYTYSDDLGATWQTAATRDDGSTHGNNRFYRIAGFADNGVIVVMATSESNSTFSTDGMYLHRGTYISGGAVTWTGPTQKFQGQTNPLRPAISWQRGSKYVRLVFYDTLGNATTGAGSGGGDIFYAMSSDYGVTWPTTATRLTSTTNLGRPTIAEDQGVINILAMRPFGNGFSSDIYQVRSSDGGTTWSNQILVATHPGPTYGYSHPIVAQFGPTVAAVWCDVQTPALMYVTSTDGGASWGTPGTVFTYSAASGTSDAPWIVTTLNYVIGIGFDTNAAYRSSNPLLAVLPRSQTVTLDDFNRVSEDPLSQSAAWAQGSVITANPGNALKTDSTGTGAVRHGWSASGPWSFDRSGSNRSGTTYTGNVEAWSDILSLGTGSDGEADIQIGDPSTGNGYAMGLAFGGFGTNVKINRYAARTPTSLGTPGDAAQAGDIGCIQLIGTELVVWRYRGTQWTEYFRGIDNTYRSSLKLSLDIAGNTQQGPLMNSFGGGTLAAPGNTSAPTVSGGTSLNSTLSVTSGVWTNSPTRYGYQWNRAGTPIAGETLPFYTTVLADVGQAITCTVTAYNAVGTTSQASSNSITPGATSVGGLQSMHISVGGLTIK